MRVLLTGAYEPLLKALRLGLEDEGFAVAVAVAAADRVPALPVPQGYDAIVLDLWRPPEAGFALIQAWRSAGLRTRVLVLATPGAPGQAGIEDWLAKPFDLDDLLARLHALSHTRSHTNGCAQFHGANGV